MHLPFFPVEGTDLAGRVDMLYLGLTLISAVYLVIIFCPMIYFAFKYRRGKKADRSPVHIKTWKLEVAWTIIPLLMMMGLFAWGASLYYEIERAPAHALEAVVVAKQWMWKIEHAEGKREINQLHVPLGQDFKLTMTSEDVIHSFYIPAFRVKQDVVPGRYVTEWFRPKRAGTYHLFCAEFCGANHSVMGGEIIVMQPKDYAEWLATGAPANAMAAEGAQLFRELGCSGCHAGSTIIHAPRLEGLYGKPIPLQDGRTVMADDEYIRDCILVPTKQYPAGYQNVMPSFQNRISEQELLQLIAYIKSIGNAAPPPDPNEPK